MTIKNVTLADLDDLDFPIIAFFNIVIANVINTSSKRIS